MDFVWSRPGASPVAIECKWQADRLDLAGLRAFRRQYPEGPNWVIAQDLKRAFRRREAGLMIDCLPLDGAVRRL